jgi:uncharacterized surface protein with fasciclin (FAS1) repeats
MIGRTFTTSSIALAAMAVVGFTQVPHAHAAQQITGSVFDALSSDPRFSTTMKMVYVAGAANRLSAASNVAIFAATDEGWDNSPYEGMLSSLSSTGAGSEFPDSMGILQVVRGFIVRGEAPTIPSADMKAESAAGRPIDFDPKAMTVKWVDPKGVEHSAQLASQPIVASNGVIYPVNAVVGN